MALETSTESQPASLKTKVFGLFWGGLIIAFGIWMLSRPDSPYFHPDEMTRAKTYYFTKFINWIWGIPGGVVLSLLGLMVIGGSFMPKKPGEDDD